MTRLKMICTSSMTLNTNQLQAHNFGLVAAETVAPPSAKFRPYAKPKVVPPTMRTMPQSASVDKCGQCAVFDEPQSIKILSLVVLVGTELQRLRLRAMRSPRPVFAKPSGKKIVEPWSVYSSKTESSNTVSGRFSTSRFQMWGNCWQHDPAPTWVRGNTLTELTFI